MLAKHCRRLQKHANENVSNNVVGESPAQMLQIQIAKIEQDECATGNIHAARDSEETAEIRCVQLCKFTALPADSDRRKGETAYSVTAVPGN